MKGKQLGAAATIGFVLLMGGCAMQSRPSFESLKADTVAVAQAVIDTFPATAIATQAAEGDPYPCDDDGYMYIGQWTVILPEGADVAALIGALPKSLGKGWEITRGSLPRSDAYVDVTDTSRAVGVAVSDYSTSDGQPTLELLATSACGAAPVGS